MDDEMKKCPFCAEMIKKEAIKCRYCGSMLNSQSFRFDFLSTPGHWHRVNEGKTIAGVCTGIAQELNALVLILPLRLFFILTTIFYGFGIILYLILWVLMPPPNAPLGGNGTTSSAGSTVHQPAGENQPESPADPSPAPEMNDAEFVEIEPEATGSDDTGIPEALPDEHRDETAP